MLEKALDLYTKPMKWGETLFNTTFGTKMCKKLYLYDFPIQMQGAIGQKRVTFYPGMLVRVFGLEIAHKKSQKLFFSIKVIVRIGCVSDRAYLV